MSSNAKDRLDFNFPFYRVELRPKGIKEIIIIESKVIEFWEKLGYRKSINSDGSYDLVLVTKNSIVKLVKDHQLRDEVRSYTTQKKLTDVWAKFIEKDYVVKKNFESLTPISISRTGGDKNTGYLFFENTVLVVTPDKIEAISYEDFQGYVWEDQIIKREISRIDFDGCDFQRFISLISNNEDLRYKSLLSIIGYLIHSYKDPSFSKAVVITDKVENSKLEKINGGTGKSLLGKALSEIVPTLYIDGKTLKSQDKFKLSAIRHSNRLIFFDDVKREFDFEDLYPLITGELQFEKKYKNIEIISYHDSPKVLIASNFPLRGTGGEAEKRRKIEFEISRYFKEINSPIEEFGYRLFDDWDTVEWLKFYNFMIIALQTYLREGIVYPPDMDLEENRLIVETSQEFVQFMQEVLQTPDNFGCRYLEEKMIFDKKELIDKFLSYRESKIKTMSPITFKKWIDKYCECYKLLVRHYKSNGNSLVEIGLKKEEKKKEDYEYEYQDIIEE